MLFTILLLIVQLIIAAFVIRFHVSVYRLGYNPLVAKLNQYTDPMVTPFKKIPLFDPSQQARFRQNPLLNKILPYDLPAIIVGFLVALIVGLLLWRSFGAVLFIFLTTWINVVFYAVLIAVIGSWLSADPQQPVMQIALSCSEWILAPLRRVIPPIGMFDFSPVVLLFILSFLSQAIVKLAL